MYVCGRCQDSCCHCSEGTSAGNWDSCHFCKGAEETGRQESQHCFRWEEVLVVWEDNGVGEAVREKKVTGMGEKEYEKGW